jgi:hypothetical protein
VVELAVLLATGVVLLGVNLHATLVDHGRIVRALAELENEDRHVRES